MLIGMKIFSFIASQSTGIKITDTTSGYRGYSAAAIRLCYHREWTYPDANLLIMLHGEGMRIVERPTPMNPSTSGKSMHSGAEPIFYVGNVFWSILKTRFKTA